MKTSVPKIYKRAFDPKRPWVDAEEPQTRYTGSQYSWSPDLAVIFHVVFNECRIYL